MNIRKKRINIGKDFLELLTHSKNYISAELVTKGLAFITLPVFTRLMTPDNYGVLSVFTSLTVIISIIFGFGIRVGITRYYYEDKQDFFEYFSSNFWFVLFAGIFLTSFTLLFQNQLQSFLNIPVEIIYISFGIVIPQVIFQLYQAYLQAAKKSKRIASLTVTQALIGTGLAIAIMVQMTDEKYYAKAIGQGIGSITLFLITLFYLKKHISLSVKKKHLAYSLVFGLPIVLHLLSQNILSTFDQIIINQLVGKYETGIYSVAYKIGIVQNIVSMGILKAWSPIFYEKMNQKKYSDIHSLAKKYGFIVMLVAVFLIFFAKEIITILADKSYHEALYIIPIIVISYFFFFLYTMFVNFAFYYKKTKNIAAITIVAGGMNILLNYLLIPKFGYIAAAWTTLVSYSILFILHYTNVRWILKIKNITSYKIFIVPVVILALMGLFNASLNMSNFDYFIILAIKLVVLTVVIYFSYRKFKPKTKSLDNK